MVITNPPRTGMDARVVDAIRSRRSPTSGLRLLRSGHPGSGPDPFAGSVNLAGPVRPVRPVRLDRPSRLLVVPPYRPPRFRPLPPDRPRRVGGRCWSRYEVFRDPGQAGRSRSWWTASGLRWMGKVLEAHLSPIPGTPLRHLLLGPESYTLAMERADGGWAVAFRGERHVMEVLDERTRHIRSLTGDRAKATGASQLRAPMPGLVLRIQVQAGTGSCGGSADRGAGGDEDGKRAAGDGSGVVQSIVVEPGQAVERGAVLVEFAAPAT